MAAEAICAIVQTGPVIELAELEQWAARDPACTWPAELGRELAWIERAELRGGGVLRYVLAHHLPQLLAPFVQRSYFLQAQQP